MHYSIRDFANLNERVGWLRLLLPIYDPAEHCIESLATGIAIGFQYVAEEPENYVTPAPLTVKADGDGTLHDTYHDSWRWWTRYGGPGRWDNLFEDKFQPWSIMRHENLANVSPCEVTL